MKKKFSLLLSTLLFLASVPVSLAVGPNDDLPPGDNPPPKKVDRRKFFTANEDQRLCQLVNVYGTSDWKLISSFMVNRNARQCRDRWTNYLSTPPAQKAPFTPDEDQIILQQVSKIGTKWTKIAKFLNNRTDYQVKNRYYILQRKLTKKKSNNLGNMPVTMQPNNIQPLSMNGNELQIIDGEAINPQGTVPIGGNLVEEVIPENSTPTPFQPNNFLVNPSPVMQQPSGMFSTAIPFSQVNINLNPINGNSFTLSETNTNNLQSVDTGMMPGYSIPFQGMYEPYSVSNMTIAPSGVPDQSFLTVNGGMNHSFLPPNSNPQMLPPSFLTSNSTTNPKRPYKKRKVSKPEKKTESVQPSEVPNSNFDIPFDFGLNDSPINNFNDDFSLNFDNDFNTTANGDFNFDFDGGFSGDFNGNFDGNSNGGFNGDFEGNFFDSNFGGGFGYN